MVSMPDSFFFKSQKIKPMLDETLLKKGLARLILFFHLWPVMMLTGKKFQNAIFQIFCLENSALPIYFKHSKLCTGYK